MKGPVGHFLHSSAAGAFISSERISFKYLHYEKGLSRLVDVTDAKSSNKLARGKFGWKAKETKLERADLPLQLLMFVTTEMVRKNVNHFLSCSFCQQLSQ